MLLKLGSPASEMADYILRVLTHLRNHTDVLRKMDRESGLGHESLLSLVNVTEDDLEYMFNLSRSRETNAYCDGAWREVAASYRHIHGYASLLVCLFGTIANLLNIVVLTRKELVGTPINRILTGIAVADMLVMLEYIPFAAYMYVLLPPGVKQFSYSEAVFILVHMHFSQLMHTVSISLTLTLALWRYLAIQFPHKSHIRCSDQRCTVVICGAFLLPVLICLPSYLLFSVRATRVVEDHKLVTLYHLDLSDLAKFPHKSQMRCSDQRCTVVICGAFLLPVLICLPSYLVFSVRATRVVEDHKFVTLYHLDLSDLAKQDNEFLYTVNFWLYAVVVKLLPCAVLTVVSYYLVSVLWQVNARKQRLRCDVHPAPDTQRTYKPEKRVDRTTKMLVAVLLLFLITEIPQGILGLLSGILGRCFFKNCYHQLGEIMDILALLNGAINFILYCSMSRQFRDTFSKMFKPKLLAKCAPPNTEVQSTYV